MSLLKDSNGDDLTFWPISGLIEGEDSAILEFNFPTPQQGQLLSELDDRLEVYCREKDVGTFQDISQTPIVLSGYAVNAAREFEIFVRALTPISGLERIPLGVSIGTSTASGWTA